MAPPQRVAPNVLEFPAGLRCPLGPTDNSLSRPAPPMTLTTPSPGPATAAPGKPVSALIPQAIALHRAHRVAEAKAIYERVLAENPNDFDALHLLGVVAQQEKDFERSRALIERAIQINPQHGSAYNNLGNTLKEMGLLEPAVHQFVRAVQLRPDMLEPISNCGNALKELGRPVQAIQCYEQALGLNPNHPEVHLNRALAKLMLGDFRAGFEEYEWRWQGEKLAPKLRQFPQPLWLGQTPLAGKTLLLHYEQGLGDTLQFCRYAPLLAAQGARVLLEVQRPLLHTLLRLPGVSVVIEKGAPLPDFDLHCPLMSLPLACRTELDTIPLPQGYLSAHPERLARWRERLNAPAGERTRPRVGLVWSGSTVHVNDRNRSLRLEQLLPHLPAGPAYYCLQKELRDVDRAALAQSDIPFLGDTLQDFDDTAALCTLMDVVVSVDTSVAHLSAALGRPTWVLLPHVPDWRWLLEREDSPWYASVQLLRQGPDRQWTTPLQRLHAQLQQLPLTS